MTISTRTALALVAFLALGALPVIGQQAGSALPGGASTLQEGYEDWQVSCGTQEAGVHCSMVQNQVDGQSRQRVLAVEIGKVDGDGASGLLLLPFGLALAQPVALQIDDGAPLTNLAFRTCLPAGCVVPIAFDGNVLAALRAGGALKIAATADGGNPANFSVSLKGFSKALDRVAALTRG